MGLSSFNAMRAREKEKAEADSKSKSAIEVREVEAPVETSEVKAEETSEAKAEEPAKDETKPQYNFQKKKTDAEKLKKKE